MKQSVLVLVVMFVVCAGVAKDANAQGGTWADRGYVNIGFGVESGSSSITDTKNLHHLRRVSHLSRRTRRGRRAAWWTSALACASGAISPSASPITRKKTTQTVSSRGRSSSIFFNRPRTLNQEVVLERKEKAAHLVIGWAVPLGEGVPHPGVRRALVLPPRAGCRL